MRFQLHFEAFLECPTKCWLRSRAEPTAGHAYAEWVQSQNKSYCEREVKRLVRTGGLVRVQLRRADPNGRSQRDVGGGRAGGGDGDIEIANW